MTFSEELAWRGFVNQTTYKDLSLLNGDPVTFYWGVDPSADSMQVGNLAAAMMVKCFIKHGHKPVLLVGGATGLIGDPDGKAEERNLLSQEELEKNKQAIAAQYKTVFSGMDFELVDNFDWFKDMNYLDFLREVGKHVPMRQMLGREFVESRLSENGAGISYAEFSYVLIQAYDFLYLYKNKNVTLQVAGADQWGNGVAGVDLIRRKTGGEAHVYSTPLIIDESTGRKFGKSEGGAVWLDPNKTSPTKFYQFWINASDQGTPDYLKIFTEFDQPKIEDILNRHNADPGQRIAQSELARSVTTLIHGEAATKTAEAVTSVLTGKTKLKDVDDNSLIEDLSREIPTAKTSEKGDIAQALVDSTLASSKTEARKLIQNNAVSINGERSSKENFDAQDFSNGRLILRRGKAFKDSALVTVG